MSFNSNITPGRPPLLWSDVNDAFIKINENFDILVATVGDGSGLSPIDFSTLDTNVSPAADNTYTLGETGTRRWKSLFLNEYSTTGSNNTNGLYLGSAHVKGIGFTVDLPANSTVDGNLIIDPAKTWFNSIQIDNDESILATEFNDSFGFTSGTGININVDSGAESIIVTNTGIITASAGSGISVSGTNPLTITNTGVRSLQNVATLPAGRSTGAGINITAGTGDNIRITNTGIIDVQAGFGIQVSTDVATGIAQVSFNSGVAPQTAFTRFHITGDLSVNDILSDNTADTFNITQGYGIILTNSPSTDTMTIALNQRIDIIGSVFADNSTLLVDGPGGRIPAEVVQGTFTGTVIGNVTGNLNGTANVASTVTLTATDTTNAAHFITFVDTATGNENVRTDTNLTYNPNSNTLTAGTFSGAFSGTLTGNVFTNLIDSADSSAIVVTPLIRFESDAIAENDLIVNNLLTTVRLSATVLNATTASVTNNLSVGGNTLSKAVQSAVTPLSGATGVVVHNYALGSTFRHVTPAANFTVNITNMNLADGFITQVRLIIVQDITPRVPTAVQIDGAAQTLLWKDNSPPTGNASKRDVVLFTISNIGGSYIVLGELATYG